MTGVEKVFDVVVPDGNDLMRKGCTLTRIRGMASFRSNAFNAGLVRGAMGLIQTQASIALAGLPDPATEPEADWLWYEAFAFMGSETTDTIERRGINIEVDNRAQRKLIDHGQIVLVYSSLSAVNTIAAMAARVLCLLP